MKKICKAFISAVMVGLLLWGVCSFIEVNQKNMSINGENKPLSEWNLIGIMCESVE